MAIQPRQPSKIAGNVSRKKGPGTIRRPSDTVGPREQPEPINAGAQSARSRAAASGASSISADGRGDNVRVIPRENLTPSNGEFYGYNEA